MELGLDLKQTQTLSPQMMQAMEILQMGSQELLEYIQEAVQENPVLETEDARQPQEEVRRMPCCGGSWNGWPPPTYRTAGITRRMPRT